MYGVVLTVTDSQGGEACAFIPSTDMVGAVARLSVTQGGAPPR